MGDLPDKLFSGAHVSHDFALGLKGLGPNTRIGGSLIVVAVIGGAIFTPIMGRIFELTRSMAKAMVVPLLCCVFLTYYAFVGSKTRVAESAAVIANS